MVILKRNIIIYLSTGVPAARLTVRAVSVEEDGRRGGDVLELLLKGQGDRHVAAWSVAGRRRERSSRRPPSPRRQQTILPPPPTHPPLSLSLFSFDL